MQNPAVPADHPQPLIVACDLDGTLLNPQEKITARTRAALARARAAGATIVLATGRPPRWMAPVLEQLDFHPYLMCANGALVIDTRDDVFIATHRLQPETLKAIVAAAQEKLVDENLPAPGFAVEVGGNIGDSTTVGGFLCSPTYQPVWKSDDEDLSSATNTVGSSPIPHIASEQAAPRTDSYGARYAVVPLEELTASPVVKILIRQPGMSSRDMFDFLHPALEHVACEVTFAIDHGLLEISAGGVTKQAGLQDVVDKTGIPADRIVAFGDMPNDIAMLRYAGLGVAMGNARDEVKNAADMVTLSHAEDGVAHVLEQLFP